MTDREINFAGLCVASFESRRAAEMQRLIERAQGIPRLAPALREVPLTNTGPAIEFAQQLLAGQIDVVIFLTGVGVRHLFESLAGQVDLEAFRHSLSRVTTVCRGPKPVVVLKEFGLEPTLRVPEPNTWRELLATLDEAGPLAGRHIVVQEYGLSNPQLTAGLQARGARVTALAVYGWDLPQDVAPLEAACRAIVDGQVDVLLFTSSPQVVHVLRVAQRLGLVDALQAACRRLVVASVGPSTSETLRAQGIGVDVEPEHPKMGPLVNAAAQRAQEVLARKRRVFAMLEQVEKPLARTPARASADDAERRPAWYDSPFMKACRREPCAHVPVWLMRQAGRYLPEYRAARENTNFLEFCKDPARCAEVMISTVNRLGVDAAIIFADLLPILEPLGFDLEFTSGEGPVIHNPVREAGDLDRVAELESVEALDFVMQTVRLTRAGLAESIPVIGFAGAPFTLASYAIEGGASRNYLHTKTWMYRDAGAWHDLMGRLARAVTQLLTAQIAAGAQAVQIFDSWVGCLGPEDYERFVLPHSRAIIAALPADVPVIHFGTGNPALLPLLARAGGQVIGVDWRIRLDDAWQQVGHDRAVQGNLDPAVLLADRGEVCRRAAQVLQQAGGRPGHIFNLGHGVLPQTPVENVLALIAAVHELGPAPGQAALRGARPHTHGSHARDVEQGPGA